MIAVKCDICGVLDYKSEMIRGAVDVTLVHDASSFLALVTTDEKRKEQNQEYAMRINFALQSSIKPKFPGVEKALIDDDEYHHYCVSCCIKLIEQGLKELKEQKGIK